MYPLMIHTQHIFNPTLQLPTTLSHTTYTTPLPCPLPTTLTQDLAHAALLVAPREGHVCSSLASDPYLSAMAAHAGNDGDADDPGKGSKAPSYLGSLATYSLSTPSYHNHSNPSPPLFYPNHSNHPTLLYLTPSLLPLHLLLCRSWHRGLDLPHHRRRRSRRPPRAAGTRARAHVSTGTRASPKIVGEKNARGFFFEYGCVETSDF